MSRVCLCRKNPTRVKGFTCPGVIILCKNESCQLVGGHRLRGSEILY